MLKASHLKAAAFLGLCAVVGYLLPGALTGGGQEGSPCPILESAGAKQTGVPPARPVPPPSVHMLSIVKDEEAKLQTVVDCAGGEEVTVRAAEGTRVIVSPWLVKEVVRASYGLPSPSPRQHDTAGLLDAFLYHQGIDLEVESSVLGGNPGPKGQNQLEATFLCADEEERRKAARHPVQLSDADEAEVRRVVSEWDAAGHDGDPCAFRDDELVFHELPDACRAYAPPSEDPIDAAPIPNSAAAERCREALYPAVYKYAERVGTLPVNYLKAIRCMMSRIDPVAPLSSMKRLAAEASPVWLVKVHGGKVYWDTDRKSVTWKQELASFSLFMMSVATLEKAVKRLREEDPSFSEVSPVYLLINALDEPKLAPPTGTAFPLVPPPGVVRDRHQAFAIPSEKWVDKWTQWGSKKMYSVRGSLLPVLSWSTIPGWQRDIIVPNRHPGSCHDFFLNSKISEIPFTEKKDTVLFRAFSSACDQRSFGPRQQLVCYAERMGGKIDIGGTTVTLDIGGGRGWGPTGSTKYMSPARQAQSKYVLLLDGVVAAFRSTWLLQSGSVILACGAWKDVRTQLLKPWIHYIPFSSDLHDFEVALRVVVLNPQYAQWVSNNARAAGKILSGHPASGGSEYDVMYFQSMLQVYSKSVSHPDWQSVDSTIRWSSDKKCADWRSTTGRIRQCLPDSYACGPGGSDVPQKRVNANYFGGSG